MFFTSSYSFLHGYSPPPTHTLCLISRVIVINSRGHLYHHLVCPRFTSSDNLSLLLEKDLVLVYTVQPGLLNTSYRLQLVSATSSRGHSCHLTYFTIYLFSGQIVVTIGLIYLTATIRLILFDPNIFIFKNINLDISTGIF